MGKKFLISYDISDEKRLAKAGRYMEKNALRVQYSIYLFECEIKEELYRVIDGLLKIVDEKEDDLRVYAIGKKKIHLGVAIDLDNPDIII